MQLILLVETLTWILTFFFKPSISAASSSNISSSEAGSDEEIKISLGKRVKLSYNMPALPQKNAQNPTLCQVLENLGRRLPLAKQ